MPTILQPAGYFGMMYTMCLYSRRNGGGGRGGVFGGGLLGAVTIQTWGRGG